MHLIKMASKWVSNTSPLGLILAGTAVVATAPAVKGILRGAAVTATRGVLSIAEGGAAIASNVREGWEDVVAEARAGQEAMQSGTSGHLDSGTVVGAGAGGALGASIGGSMAGATGAVVGGGLGSVVGAGAGSAVSEKPAHQVRTEHHSDQLKETKKTIKKE